MHFKYVSTIYFILQRYGKTLSYYIKGVHGVKKTHLLAEVVLESFAKFTGKHLCLSHFLIKL